METFRLARALLTRKEKLKLLGLGPWVLAASVMELAVVGSAAGFFRLIGDSGLLERNGRMHDLFVLSGLTRPGFLVAAGVTVLAVVVVGNVVTTLANHKVHRFAWDQNVEIAERLLGSYLFQPYEFFLTRSTPELAHRLIGEVQTVVKQVIVQGTLIFAKLLGAFLIIAWLVWREPFMTAVLFTLLGGTYGAMFILLRRTLRENGKLLSIQGKARNRQALESLGGAKEIKLLGLETTALQMYRGPSSRYAHTMAHHHTLNTLAKHALETVSIGGLVLVVLTFLLSDRPVEDVLPVMATFAVAGFRLLPTFQIVFATAAQLQTQAYALERIHEDITARPPAPDAAKATVPFERSVALKSATYRYPAGDTPVVQGLDLELARGSWTALVGTTGSGKSTVVDLLMGLLRPQDGTLEIDGKPIVSSHDVAAWQQHIGYVPQSMFVTHDTIAKNIAFGVKDPDPARIAEAARLAAVADFIENELPEGYHTEVGERGLRLSGGQRQRMGIARAFYRNPEFLVLDEATSALDNQTEASVMRELRARHANTTVLMVAHRLTTTRHCDEILMMEAGRIVARGTFDHLYATNASFQQMVDAVEDDAVARRAPVAAEPA